MTKGKEKENVQIKRKKQGKRRKDPKEGKKVQKKRESFSMPFFQDRFLYCFDCLGFDRFVEVEFVDTRARPSPKLASTIYRSLS